MNYPMKNGSIDWEFVFAIERKMNEMDQEEREERGVIECVLLAAQEVMQEMEPEIEVGDTVRWRGIDGRVTAVREDGEYFYVDFEDGVKSGMYKRHLTKTEEAQHGEG